MKKVLILGANSAMARALARKLAGPKIQFILASRNLKELERNAHDLEIRGLGPKPIIKYFDAMQPEQHEKFLAGILKQVKSLDEVYLFFGLLHDQKSAQKDFHLAQEMIVTNYLGAVSILERIAQLMEKAGHGLLVVVSSVAGDRGRQSNYLYGSAKAGLTTYLQGLRNRLAHAGVHVMTVQPGFVDTPMTRNLQKGILFAQPEAIAAGIIRAKNKKKDIVYLPFFWKWIMMVVKAIPEGIFKKLRM